MEDFPYSSKDPDMARRNRLVRKAVPIAAAAAAGLVMGMSLSREINAESQAPVRASDSLVPSCEQQSQWHNLPKATNRKFLASLLNVEQARAETAQAAVVVCDQKIFAGQVPSRPIDVAGKEGPCLPLELIGKSRPVNPMLGYHTVLAVCAGPKPNASI